MMIMHIIGMKQTYYGMMLRTRSRAQTYAQTMIIPASAQMYATIATVGWAVHGGDKRTNARIRAKMGLWQRWA